MVKLFSSMRGKTLLVVITTFAVLSIVCYVILRAVLLPRFDAYESAEVRSGVGRATAALADEAKGMERRAYDWSVWDDTYRFIEDGNAAYQSSNLVDSVFPATDIDVLAFVRLDGRLVWGGQYDPTRKVRVELSPVFRDTLFRSPLLQQADSRSMRSGLIQTPVGPLLLVSAPILTSEEKGPAKGTMLMGRLYDEERVRKLGELTRLSLTLAQNGAPSLPAHFRPLFTGLPAGAQPVTMPLSEDFIVGGAVVPDILGEPAYVVGVEASRQIHRQGVAAERFLIGSVVGMVAICALVLSGFLGRLVISPLERLTLAVQRIGSSQTFDARVGQEGDDEVAHLSREIDRMLGALSLSQQELRRAYDELDRTQAVAMREDRLRALGQMASGIAHDINNALVPILGLADLLACDPRIPEHAQKQMGTVKRASEGIAATVARLRRFYRAHPENATRDVLDLNAIVREAVDLTRPRWRDTPQRSGRVINLETDFAKGLAVMGSEVDLREAVTNLLLNAVDAMPEGGQLRVRTFQSSGPDEPSRVAVEVSDSGIGMDEETRRRCLDPFYTTKGERGTGLGLSIVYGTVMELEGDISVESAPGAGTTIRLTFPAAGGSPASSEPVSQPVVISKSSLRILCIDDEPLVCQMTKDMLVHQGHEVAAAGDGAAGIAQFKASLEQGMPFDVVVTDLGMPHTDGRRVAAAVKMVSPETPVILLTGWGLFLGDDASKEPHIDLILAKPASLTSLQDALAKVIRNTLSSV